MKNKLRKVQFQVYDQGEWSKWFTGYFHCWGTMSNESSNGNTTDTVAIVEDEHGYAHNVLVDRIIFSK